MSDSQDTNHIGSRTQGISLPGPLTVDHSALRANQALITLSLGLAFIVDSRLLVALVTLVTLVGTAMPRAERHAFWPPRPRASSGRPSCIFAATIVSLARRRTIIFASNNATWTPSERATWLPATAL